MKYGLTYLFMAFVAFSCSPSSQGDDGPDLSSMIEGVYKINYIANNGVDGTTISDPSYNVLVNRKGYTTADIREVTGNSQTIFTEVPLTVGANNKIEFSQSNGSDFIRGYFLNGTMEYTLIKGNTYKVVKARR